MPYKTYKHLSPIEVTLKYTPKICEYPHNPEKLQIKEILLKPAFCAEQERGITALQHAITTKTALIVEEYKNFKIFRISDTYRQGSYTHVGTLFIANENVEALMEEDLMASNGILGYWDESRLAFVVHNNQPLMAKAIKSFLENLTSAELKYMPIFKDTLEGLSIK